MIITDDLGGISENLGEAGKISEKLGEAGKISEKLGEARRGEGVNALWQSLRTLPKCVM